MASVDVMSIQSFIEIRYLFEIIKCRRTDAHLSEHNDFMGMCFVGYINKKLLCTVNKMSAVIVPISQIDISSVVGTL
jgi:hypothetical protein